MKNSIDHKQVTRVMRDAADITRRTVNAGGRQVKIRSPFPSPEDWRDIWIYNLMIDRFCNPDKPPAHDWSGECDTFQGGTFQGVTARMDYLADLGVGAIWLSPVLKNCQSQDSTYHGYGFQDFLTVDPRFGTEDDLVELVDQAHARGIYVIFDIVLNHCGDIFAYKDHGSSAPWSDTPYTVLWRDENGQPRDDWKEAPQRCHADAAVFPDELRFNRFFRRQGKGGEAGGDFESLKELVTEYLYEDSPLHGRYYPVRDILIKIYQYIMARFDIDGYRIDTLKYVSPEFSRIFGNAIREFACSINKKNFFTFGEIWDSEEKIASFIGRNSSMPDQPMGVDAALDFPLFYRLPGACKGMNGLSASGIANVFEVRKRQHKKLLGSHGEAGRYFVTFLDNHDQHARYFYPGSQGRYDAQLSLGVCLLFTLQGIPCLYYGTEQGLHGSGNKDLAVREALWGMQGAFNTENPFCKAVKAIADLRAGTPALRYGRQYFREISGNGTDFGISSCSPGIITFSRILNDTEALVIANTQTDKEWAGEVLVDFALNPPRGPGWRVLYSNISIPSYLPEISETGAGEATVNRHRTGGRIRSLSVSLRPMEVQVMLNR